MVLEDKFRKSKCKIHFIKAMSGDSFLIELGDGHCILIDCGYKSTYESELKPILQKLHNEGCRLDLLVITHMDEDHMGGAIALIEDNGDNRKPKIIAIDNIWFNGIFDVCRNYDFLYSHLVEKLSESDYSKKEYLLSQFLRLIGVGDGFISAKHAEAFEVLCRAYNYSLNNESENGLIMVGDRIEIGKWNDLKVIRSKDFGIYLGEEDSSTAETVLLPRKQVPEGVKAGVPDLCLPVARGQYHGLYMELKRQRGGRTSDHQSEWLDALSAQGYKAALCYGWEQAAGTIIEYLTGGGTHD